MPRLVRATHAYRRHKASGKAMVTIAGRDHYLGPWNSKASKVEYDRLIGEWLAAGRPSFDLASAGQSLSVTELVAAYWTYAKGHYVKNGKPTSEVDGMKTALRFRTPTKKRIRCGSGCEKRSKRQACPRQDATSSKRFGGRRPA